MFTVVKKLKFLKKPLRKLLYDKGNLHENVNRLRVEVERVQKDLDADPFNQILRDEEACYVRAFTDALIMEERFLKQKAKVEWLHVGDSNSAYFHKSVKGRISRNRIDVITDMGGNLITGEGVPSAFVSHYEAFLGQSGITGPIDFNDLITTQLDPVKALEMIQPVSAKEVKDAMFSMGNDKSPGPDGYTACFFKESWNIVGADVTNAIQEFFTNGNLLKELNHTIIALVPKVKSPTRINDYRPISCCNVLFKCVTKIISNRIKESLKMLISPNQSAFVPDRRISDNILLTQELMHNYHLDRGSPRCAFKVDIQKAYDTVDWDFLKQVLLAFGFHDRMILWIMECVTTTSFSISINGTLHGYFKGKRGLRQGDPMSPYLFTLVMEVFTLMLKRKVRDSHDFIYHRYCADLELINLCFADDLFIFAHGDPSSAKVIMEAMEEFKNASGLVPSLPKSTAYFCNVLNHTKLAILQILPFEEGRLSVKYLGVPLVSSRLVFRDCKELIDRLRSRINDWKNKSLSAAGRLQLVRSVVSSMHVYWASVFILPSQIILDIEQLMRGFLWCHGDMSKGKAKVSWEVVCLPKNEGGLGVRRLDTFNKALMVPHIWNLLARKDSLWVKWIHVYKLRGRHFFDIPYRGCMTWGWRKLLQLRPLIRDYLWFRIGTGNTCSLWFDKWSSMQPLANIISCRDIHRAGFSLCSKVNDAIRDGAWVWPEEWLSKYPSLISVAAPMLSNEVDQLEWHNSMGVVKHFSVREVWETIRPRSDVVDWYHVVWFPNCIPSHAFHLWLIAKRRLKTQDRLRPWDSCGGSLPTCCPLCDGPPDSHDHLFFDCAYSSQIWNEVKSLAGLPNVVGSIVSIVNSLIPIAKRRTIRSVIAKLVVAATSYYIWQERNSRLFANKKRSHGQLTECIKSTVRLKLLSCMFKKSKDALFFKHLWDLPNSSFR
ncbi:hypothetical protein Tco_1485357 [Tanacetum coccineum]